MITDELDTIWKEAIVKYLRRVTEENQQKTLHITTGVPLEIRSEHLQNASLLTDRYQCIHFTCNKIYLREMWVVSRWEWAQDWIRRRTSVNKAVLVA
jgi:hypothetical protein